MHNKVFRLYSKKKKSMIHRHYHFMHHNLTYIILLVPWSFPTSVMEALEKDFNLFPSLYLFIYCSKKKILCIIYFMHHNLTSYTIHHPLYAPPPQSYSIHHPFNSKPVRQNPMFFMIAIRRYRATTTNSKYKNIVR